MYFLVRFVDCVKNQFDMLHWVILPGYRFIEHESTCFSHIESIVSSRNDSEYFDYPFDNRNLITLRCNRFPIRALSSVPCHLNNEYQELLKQRLMKQRRLASRRDTSTESGSSHLVMSVEFFDKKRGNTV